MIVRVLWSDHVHRSSPRRLGAGPGRRPRGRRMLRLGRAAPNSDEVRRPVPDGAVEAAAPTIVLAFGRRPVAVSLGDTVAADRQQPALEALAALAVRRTQ